MKYHQTKKGKHDDRITVLEKVKDNFNYDGINFPTSDDDIAHFEKVNKVSIFIYVIGQKGPILKERCGCIEYANKPILLLRLEDEDKSHYVYIKDISKLLCLSVKRKDQGFKHCLYCDKFVLRDIHDKHMSEIRVLHVFLRKVLQCGSRIIKIKFKGHLLYILIVKLH